VTTPLWPEELERYARHIVLREIGGAGQRRLRAARVLVVGAGGLGCPALLYLAAAGVGALGVIDDDDVSLSNLQRQVLFGVGDLGRPKAACAAAALARVNPHVAVTPMRARFGAEGPAAAAALVADWDLALDGTDSFASRRAVNAACVAAERPLIAAAIGQWEGQISLYDPARGGPCFACVFAEAPAPGLAPSCAEAGVVGALPGVMGALMALEAIKQIARAGEGLRGRMLIFDGLSAETRRIVVRPRGDCPVCGGRGAAAGPAQE
jgi:molybdopterin/thiamine biosynthesis adenylyltransferase